MRIDRRTVIAIALTVAILALLNFSIYDRERTIANGEILFLELAPVDPRSLMQGDYMQLRYAIERPAPPRTLSINERRGYLVIRGNAQNVAEFVRFHGGEQPGPSEKLLRFHEQRGQIRIVPDAFFFQEGHADLYDEAKYGVFKFDDRGRHILVGLADGDRVAIEPQ